MLYRTIMSSDVRPMPPLTVGSLLRTAWTQVMDELFKGLAEAGYDGLRPVHRPILRELLVSGRRPTELGEALGLSKQAINDLLREFEANGYITLEPDPDDGRAKRIVATDRGWSLIDAASGLSNAVGRRWATQVGEERYAVFEDVLRDIVASDDAMPDS
jgi:DNA-binding MarR family transcriptional regulator